MKFQNIKWLAAVALLLAAFGSQAAEAPSSSYRIDLTIARDGSIVARPIVVVEAGAESEVRNEDPLKPDSGFKVVLTASPLDFNSNGKESIKLDVAFSGQQGGKWVVRGQHSVTAVLGKPLSFGFPPSKLEPNGQKFELTIVPSSVPADALKAK